MDKNLSYDLDYLKEISNNDQAFLEDMVHTFIENTPDALNEMRQFMENKDWQKLGKSAHKFAPSVQFIGVQEIVNDLDVLEEHAMKEKNIDTIPELMNKVENSCNHIIALLKKDFNI